MSNKQRILLAGSAWGLAIICGAGLALRGFQPQAKVDRSPGDTAKANDPAAVHDRAPYDPEVVDKTVKFWDDQAKRDPQGAIEQRELAGAYLARQRESGNIADAVKAEEAARQSLKILPRNNSAALIRLSRSLLAQHRFPDALVQAQRAATLDPNSGRLVADIQMELGNYQAARRSLADSPSEPNDLNYFALRARLEEISGKPEAALGLLRQAQRLADLRPDMPAETVAWYHAMIGHALIDSGKLDEGEQECLDALKVFPRDYRAMTGLAESAAWRRDWAKTIAWGEKAIRIAPQNPEVLKLLGDAQAALGRPKESEQQYAALKILVHSFPRIYDRHWAVFCADKGRDLDEALIMARQDLELRRDIHAYDTLAWVCLKKGMLPEAESAMKSALAIGTQESTLFYHAAMIAQAAGDPAGAEEHLARARAINPYSVPTAEPEQPPAGENKVGQETPSEPKRRT